jgi:peptidoglycan/xylan/chitin deacetylase (PgdA/CDA1 family)
VEVVVMTRAGSLWLAPVALLLLLHAPEARGGAPERGRVALTFDDLPAHAALPPGRTRTDVAKSVLEALRAAGAPPVYGFVNAKALVDDPTTEVVLRLWTAAGNPLGNHAFSHMDLDANSVEAFEKDVLADEATLRRHMAGGDWHWFRYPYLHEGSTLETRNAIRWFLAGKGYRIAQVTMSFDDYAYNDPYARCMTKGDQAAIEWMKESYARRAGESIEGARAAARRAFGRDIAHVMLLHIGAFQTVMLPRLLEIIHEHGVELVSLTQAEDDPVYALDPARTSGGTFLGQMAAAMGLPPSPSVDDTLKRLDGLCR